MRALCGVLLRRQVDGSSMSLLGNNHDDDMRHIAELTISRLQALVYSRPAAAAAALPPAPPSVSQQQSKWVNFTQCLNIAGVGLFSWPQHNAILCLGEG